MSENDAVIEASKLINKIVISVLTATFVSLVGVASYFLTDWHQQTKLNSTKLVNVTVEQHRQANDLVIIKNTHEDLLKQQSKIYDLLKEWDEVLYSNLRNPDGSINEDAVNMYLRRSPNAAIPR